MEKEIEDLKEHKFLGVVLIKSNSLLSSIKKLIINTLKIINKDKIDKFKLKIEVDKGILELQPSLRSLCWKIFMNYLPEETENWESYIDDKRNEYNKMKNKFTSHLNSIIKSNNDHPLNNTSNSIWQGYFKNNKLYEIIEKDLKRTRNEEPFFKEQSKQNPKETNLEVLKRILFIFAQKYPDICYVQGLNEILATIFYCFSLDQNPYFNIEVEADSFYCFESLITRVGDIYITEKDYTETGLQTRLDYIKFILQTIDYELYSALNDTKIDISLITFKWYTLFFSQDFSIKGTMRIWDYLLVQKDLFNFLNILCICVLKVKRKIIMNRDYSEIMDTLQCLNEEDISPIISKYKEIETEIEIHQSFLNYNAFTQTIKHHG